MTMAQHENKWAVLPVSGPESFDRPEWACVLLSPKLLAWMSVWRGVAQALAPQKGFYCLEFFSHDTGWFSGVPDSWNEVSRDWLDASAAFMVDEYPATHAPMELSVCTARFTCSGDVMWLAYPKHMASEYETVALPEEVFDELR